jgi:hypothetical protein
MLISCLAVGKVPTVRNCIQPPPGGLTRLEAPLPETSVELANPAFAACVPRARSFEDSGLPPRRRDDRGSYPDAPSAAGHAGGGREYGRQPRAAPSDRHVAGGGLAPRHDGRRRHPGHASGLGLSGNGSRGCRFEPDHWGHSVIPGGTPEPGPAPWRYPETVPHQAFRRLAVNPWRTLRGTRPVNHAVSSFVR